jgi:predicted HTH domain antitoxin
MNSGKGEDSAEKIVSFFKACGNIVNDINHSVLLMKEIKMVSRLTIDYPDSLPDALHQSTEQFEHEARMAMAVKLFELKRLSSGMAAKLAGVDRVSFLLRLHGYKVSMIDYDNCELESDINNA